ncbi:MAG TPA: hypothetical protein VK920_12095, partial [Solirubrobacterales bacterium]|nr:hypothetical protein [Solirubrobacterales bacterium]
AAATAPAPARRRPARRAPAKRRRPARRREPARRAADPHLIPSAAARTAGAVGDIADSGLMVRLTRGRLWIAVLATLLAGIVALNVVSLSFSSSASRVAERSEQLKQANSVLEARLAKKLSSQRVKSIAAGLGFEIPKPEDIVYLSPDGRDPHVAARRIQAGEVGGPADLAEAPVTPTDPPAAP